MCVCVYQLLLFAVLYPYSPLPAYHTLDNDAVQYTFPIITTLQIIKRCLHALEGVLAAPAGPASHLAAPQGGCSRQTSAASHAAAAAQTSAHSGQTQLAKQHLSSRGHSYTLSLIEVRVCHYYILLVLHMHFEGVNALRDKEHVREWL